MEHTLNINSDMLYKVKVSIFFKEYGLYKVITHFIYIMYSVLYWTHTATAYMSRGERAYSKYK